TRSVPEGWSSRVILTGAPKDLAASAMRVSSVATMIWDKYRAALARSKTCCNIVFPAMTERAFPGKRDEANLAGITPRIRVGTFDHSMKEPAVILRTSLTGVAVAGLETRS